MANKTIVVFRKWPKKDGGDIIALMPADPATLASGDCVCYQHIGQHGAAHYHHVMRFTKPASPDEYAPLLRELTSAPYNYTFDIRSRYTRRKGGR